MSKHQVERACYGSLPRLHAHIFGDASRSSCPLLSRPLQQHSVVARPASKSILKRSVSHFLSSRTSAAPALPKLSSQTPTPSTHAPQLPKPQSVAQRAFNLASQAVGSFACLAAFLGTAHAVEDDVEWVPPEGFEFDTEETEFQDAGYNGDDQTFNNQRDGDEEEDEVDRETSFAESWRDRNWKDETLSFLSAQGGPSLISEGTAVAGARLNVGSAGDGHTPEIAAFVRSARLDMSASRALHFGDPQVLPLGLGLVSVHTCGSVLSGLGLEWVEMWCMVMCPRALHVHFESLSKCFLLLSLCLSMYNVSQQSSHLTYDSIHTYIHLHMVGPEMSVMCAVCMTLRKCRPTSVSCHHQTSAGTVMHAPVQFHLPA